MTTTAREYPASSSSSSIQSLDLAMDSNKCPSLLSNSPSLASVSSVSSSGSVPAFPLGCMVPMSTIIGIKSNLSMLAGGSGVEGLYEQREIPKATTTVPTPPRLRTMLKENLCIKKWVDNLPALQAPGHVPWGSADFMDDRPLIWIPEGSIHTPEYLNETLAKARLRRQPGYFNSPGSLRHSYRQALVFEREITLRSGNTTKRWSLQVPARTMNPEIVDTLLELKTLNSFFRHSLAEEPEDFRMEEEAEEPIQSELPSLVVSNSHCAMPLCLESCGNLQITGSAAPLAARRGKKMPTPLTCTQPITQDPYPGIPTAFLGSPSTYSPTFQLLPQPQPNHIHSMDLNEMLGSLRSQGASLQSQTQHHPVVEEEAVPDNVEAWSCDPKTPDTPSEIHFSIPTEVDLDETLVEANQTSDMNDTEPLPVALPEAPSIGKELQQGVDPPASPPMSSSPTMTLNMGSPRSILKRCKSVRFASDPLELLRDDLVDTGVASECAPRTSLDSLTPSSPRQSSPLRHSYTPGSPRRAKSFSPATSPVRSAMKPVKTNGIPRVVLPPFESPSTPPRIKPIKPKSSLDLLPKRVFETAAVGRHSLAIVIKGPNKENKNVNRLSFSPKSGAHRSRLTMDENSFRRARSSLDSSPKSSAQKSRMPVPLRNILTRFK